MAELDVLPRGVEVEEEVLAAHHRIQIEAGNMLLEALLLLLLRRNGQLRLHLQPLHVHQHGVDCQRGLAEGAVLVAVQKGGEGALLLPLLSGLRQEHRLPPEVHEVHLPLRRVEQ